MSYFYNEDMEKGFVSIVEDIFTVSGVKQAKVFWTMQDAFDDRAAVEPTRDFITLNYMAGPNPIDRSEIAPSGGGNINEFNYYQTVEFTISINLYCTNGHLAKANKLEHSLQSDPYKQRLSSLGLALMDSNNIGDISQFDETRFKLRSHIDLVFNYISILENVNVGVIEHVYVNGDIDSTNVSFESHK